MKESRGPIDSLPGDNEFVDPTTGDVLPLDAGVFAPDNVQRIDDHPFYREDYDGDTPASQLADQIETEQDKRGISYNDARAAVLGYREPPVGSTHRSHSTYRQPAAAERDGARLGAQLVRSVPEALVIARQAAADRAVADELARRAQQVAASWRKVGEQNQRPDPPAEWFKW